MEGQWKEYFVFSRRERVAIILLMLIILILILLPSFLPKEDFPIEQLTWIKTDSVKDDNGGSSSRQGNDSPGDKAYTTGYSKNNQQYLDNTRAYRNYGSKREIVLPSSLFYFDPNTASAADLKKLGIRDRQVLTIQRYISKGGRFRKAEDLAKVYGLSEEDQQRLMPYVRIKPEDRPSFKDNQQPKNMQTLEINAASRNDWERLPGIGATLALRIVTFREKLGGFYSVLQVAETYGLPDSTYRKIMGQLICDSTACKKIPINNVSEEQLKAHPYLRGMTGAALVNYRKEHGNFASLEDIRKVKLIDEVLYKRIRPYLKTD